MFAPAFSEPGRRVEGGPISPNASFGAHLTRSTGVNRDNTLPGKFYFQDSSYTPAIPVVNIKPDFAMNRPFPAFFRINRGQLFLYYRP